MKPRMRETEAPWRVISRLTGTRMVTLKTDYQSCTHAQERAALVNACGSFSAHELDEEGRQFPRPEVADEEAHLRSLMLRLMTLEKRTSKGRATRRKRR